MSSEKLYEHLSYLNDAITGLEDIIIQKEGHIEELKKEKSFYWWMGLAIFLGPITLSRL